jgi:hypothetical protein
VYLRVGEPGTEGRRTAVSTAPIEVGSRARIASSTKMEAFRSATLDRTFDVIYFGVLDGEAGKGGADPHAGLTAPSPHAGAGEAPKPGAVPVGNVEKATGPNALRVEEVHGRKAELGGKTIRVRGVVVKSTSGVMGKTFLHLRDGSGDEASGSHDLTVTTDAVASVGDTVTIEGTVAVDRDLGAGYRYPVMVEGARLTQGDGP